MLVSRLLIEPIKPEPASIMVPKMYLREKLPGNVTGLQGHASDRSSGFDREEQTIFFLVLVSC
jgi:hypothetical protein